MTSPPLLHAVANAAQEDALTPIVIDLDGVLLLTDAFDEGLAAVIFGRPLKLLTALPSLIRSRAAFKRAIAEATTIDVEVLPVRQPLLAWLHQQRDQGSPLDLISAADQTVVDAIAARFGLFGTATTSARSVDLKRHAWRDVLTAQFPDGFIYCGGSSADIPVFLASRGAVLCDAPTAVASAVAGAGIPVLARFDRQQPTAKDVIGALRVHQWSKNLLIFAPLVLGHVYMQPKAVMTSAAGFLILSVLASSSYLANDVADLGADRRHPSKRERALASGLLSLRFGLLLAPALAVASLVAAWTLSPHFAGALMFYFVLTSLYSWKLKEIPLLDVLVIGALFTARILMGAALLALPQSVWLLSFSMFLFLSLALAKRHVEILAMADGVGAGSRRGYEAADWPLSLVFGVGAGLVSVLIMLLFMTSNAAPSGLYHHSLWLYVIPAALMAWIMRIWLLSHRGRLRGDPVLFALRDKPSLALAAVVVAAFIAAL